MEAFYQAVFWKILHILLYISLTKQYTACYDFKKGGYQ